MMANVYICDVEAEKHRHSNILLGGLRGLSLLCVYLNGVSSFNMLIEFR